MDGELPQKRRLPDRHQRVGSVRMQALNESLVGTAGELPTSKVPSIKFAEDVTPEEIVDLEARQDAEAMEHAEGNIPALQFRPGGGQRDDGKAIRYRYNYFVTGGQVQILQILSQYWTFLYCFPFSYCSSNFAIPS